MYLSLLYTGGSVELIPHEEDMTPPTVRRPPPPRLSCSTEVQENSSESPRLPPRPARLSLTGHLSAQNTLQRLTPSEVNFPKLTTFLMHK